MTIAERVAALRRFSAGHRRLLALVAVAALVVVGSTTAVAVTTSVAAAEQARAEAEAAAALELRIIDYYEGALDRLQPFGTQLVDDATAWATSESPLLTADDVAGLESTAEAVAESQARSAPDDATSEELEHLFDSKWAMIQGARERFEYFVDRAHDAAKAHLDAAPIAKAATRQALVDAMDALDEAEKTDSSFAAPLGALTAAVAGVDASQKAVAAARAAAAAAEARRSGVAGRPGSGAATGSPKPVCAGTVLTCVNQIRAYYGFGALSSNGTLNSAAQTCAQRMADASSMTHSSPTPGFSWWGENIAHGYTSQVAVFNAWMNSPGHRANILNSHYRYMGFGHVASGNWWCQQFGS